LASSSGNQYHETINPEPEYAVYLLSLGCAKNLVDAECMSRIITDGGYHIVNSPEMADILVINTCGFIEDAKKEAIEAILRLAELKQPQGQAQFLVVTGCLSQRYAREIRTELPEVDVVLGTAEYSRIASVIKDLRHIRPKPENDAGMPPPGSLEHLNVDRQPSTTGRYAYVKIAEGCSNCCTYCAIPGIRGPYRSRPMEDIINEARRLSAAGWDEIILIAQDSTRYGIDLYQKPMLAQLLPAICSLDPVRMVRILYVYADMLDDSLIQIMAKEPKIAHYLDLPIQHADDGMLRRMNRRDSQADLRRKIVCLRRAMPDLILRTTVMVGFPGETEAEFAALKAFLEEIRFERLGCFIFSPEEGTPAFSLHPRIRKSVASARQKAILDMQRKISCEANRRRIGQVIPVALESVDERGIFYIGRSYGEAPEVDPVIYVAGTAEHLSVGQTCPVRLIDAGDYDMTGVTEL